MNADTPIGDIGRYGKALAGYLIDKIVKFD
jgi:hypothetical protein